MVDVDEVFTTRGKQTISWRYAMSLSFVSDVTPIDAHIVNEADTTISSLQDHSTKQLQA